MSSCIFDFAIGMGASDFGGSIQQPLVDREVISIGGSSSEETHCGASDNESSSSESWSFYTMLVEALLTFVGRPNLLVLLRSGNLSQSPWFFPLLFLGERGRVVVETLWHPPVCDVAIMLGCHCPSYGCWLWMGEVWCSEISILSYFCGEYHYFVVPREVGQYGGFLQASRPALWEWWFPFPEGGVGQPAILFHV